MKWTFDVFFIENVLFSLQNLIRLFDESLIAGSFKKKGRFFSFFFFFIFVFLLFSLSLVLLKCRSLQKVCLSIYNMLDKIVYFLSQVVRLINIPRFSSLMLFEGRRLVAIDLQVEKHYVQYRIFLKSFS